MIDFAAHTARAIQALGSSATVTPSGASPVVVTGVFTAKPDLALNLVDGFAPTLRLKQADAAGLEPGDAAQAGGANYTIARIERFPEAGDAVLHLESL